MLDDWTSSPVKMEAGELIGRGCIAIIVSPSYPKTCATAHSFDLC